MIRCKEKISHRFFAAFFIVAVIPIFIMGVGLYKAAEKTLIDSAYMHIRTIAQDHANRLDTWYGERLDDIKVLSGLSPIREMCCSPGSKAAASVEKTLIADSLALTRGKSPAYESIHVMSPSGEIVASTEANSEMIVTKKYLEDLENLKTAEGPVLSPLHQHLDRTWYIHLTVPVYSRGGAMSAAIMAILHVSGTIDPLLADRTGLGNTGEAYLVNGEGKIVTQSRYLGRDETSKRKFETVGIVSALDRKEGISIYRNYLGREVVGAYRWLPRYHSALLVEMGKDEILAPVRVIRIAVLSTAALVSLICILASFLLSRQISRPISEMAKASRKMANGSLDQRISYSRRDEIGTLAEGFNSMAEDLSSLIDSLKQKEISLQKAYDELMQAQSQLVQSEKMAAVGELVASVVHEMRNPLSSVKLNFQIIGRSLDRSGPVSEHYSIGLDQVAQLEKMLTSLLDYSKPVALAKTPFRIETVIAESIGQLQSCTEGCSIEVKTHEVLPQIMGDPEQIRQVFANVIKNAVESSGHAGKIEVRIRPCEKDGNKGVLVEIADNGAGISQQDLKRIFQPFFTTKEKGTGLGLSVVKKIMEAHGFGLSVSSQEGAGTVVSLHLQGA
ncbi:putative Histidine kinase [Syntrophobacter sp. SbD1]|nr:putative Histidine kinase [Syntrophobacter sp. SbD1]